MDNPQEIRELLVKHGLAEKADALMALVRPSVRIFTQPADDSELPVGVSKIGGEPDLPPGFEWPMWEREPPDWFIKVSERYNELLPEKIRPLGFLAQFNLAEVATYDVEHLLPSSGMLYFFYDGVEQPREEFTLDGGARVYYYAGTDIERTSAPPDLPARSQFKPCRVTFETEWMLPWPYSPFIDASRDDKYRDPDAVRLSEEEQEAYWKVWDVWTLGKRHHLFGYPYAIQDSPEYECVWKITPRRSDAWLAESERARRWRLLFQLDTDENADMWWASGGKVYFCIPDEALAARRFKDGIQIMQFS